MHTGQEMAGSTILWIDCDAAIALHCASDRKSGVIGKSRSARLASATASEKRVSQGCIIASADVTTASSSRHSA